MYSHNFRAFFRISIALPLLALSLQAQPKVVQILDEELQRNFSALKKSDPAPYFMSYELFEQEAMSVTGTLGTLQGSTAGKSRSRDVSIRIECCGA